MSTFSVGGLSSGLDTKSIISQLVAIDSRPKTLMEWKAQLNTARSNAWKDLQSKLASLENAGKTLLKPETWNVATGSGGTGTWAATSGDPSRLSAVTSGTPTAGSYGIDVLQLARGEISVSTGALSPATSGVRSTGTWYKAGPAAVAGTETLTSLRNSSNVALGLNTNSTITMNYTVNGVAQSANFKVNTTGAGGNGTTLAQFSSWVASTIGNGASAAWVGGKLQVTTAPGTAPELDAMSFTAVNASGTTLTNFNAAVGASSSVTTAASDGGTLASAGGLTIANGSGSWNVALAAGDTKQDIVNKINGTSGIGVIASMVGSNIQLRSTTTGAAAGFTVTGSSASALGFNETQSAQDAQYTVNGTAYSSATNNNVTGAIANVALNFSGTTSTTLTVAQSSGSGQSAQEDWIDAVRSKVQDFAKQYNAVLSQVYQKTQGESRVINPKTLGDYLTGPLSRNTQYSNVSFDLRQQLQDPVAGLASGANMLSDFGITTSFDTKTPGANGSIVIDETKLEAALRTDPAAVQAALTKIGGGAGTTTDDGFIRRITERSLAFQRQIDDSLSNMSTSARRLQDSIDAASRRIDMRQKNYERMFASLETTLGKMQSQSSWLSGQLASLSGGQSG